MTFTAGGLSGAEARRAAAARLAAAGVDAPELDARLLLAAATGLDAAALAAAPERALSDDEAERFAALVAARAARRPIAQILGRVGFWTLELAVTADVLVPRPETECVLEAALAATAERETGRALDLGVGSGALLLAFLSERPGWSGVGVDASAPALAVARANAAALGLDARAGFVAGGWDTPLDARFDLVMSNPPYIETAAIDALEPEVRDHEPRLALDGGADGLDAYRAITGRARALLAPGGALVFEIGATQADAVAALARAALPEAEITVAADLGARPRAVVACTSEPL